MLPFSTHLISHWSIPLNVVPTSLTPPPSHSTIFFVGKKTHVFVGCRSTTGRGGCSPPNTFCTRWATRSSCSRTSRPPRSSSTIWWRSARGWTRSSRWFTSGSSSWFIMPGEEWTCGIDQCCGSGSSNDFFVLTIVKIWYSWIREDHSCGFGKAVGII